MCAGIALRGAADYSPVATAERSAARLAHQSGGLGVAGSNPAAPTSPAGINQAPEHHKAIGRIKDYGSAAVFSAICLAGLVWLTALALRLGLI